MLGPTWNLGAIAGIPVRIHWTLPALIAGLAVAEWLATGAGGAAFTATVLCSLFACVLLHEVGHAMAARQFNMPTHSITLMPLGGVAAIQSQRLSPGQELWVALAGPAVNLVIAGLLYALIAVTTGHTLLETLYLASSSLTATLLWLNVGLVLFNLIPAFPMDGGRVLRALLGMGMSHLLATQIAVRVGQVFAVAFALWAVLTGQLMLLLISAFVFLAASAELQLAQRQAAHPSGRPWGQPFFPVARPVVVVVRRPPWPADRQG